MLRQWPPLPWQPGLVAVLSGAWVHALTAGVAGTSQDFTSRTRFGDQDMAPVLSHLIELTCTTCMGSAPEPISHCGSHTHQVHCLLTRNAGLSNPAGRGAPRHQAGAEMPHRGGTKRSIARPAAKLAGPAHARFVRRFAASSRCPTNEPSVRTNPHRQLTILRLASRPASAGAGGVWSC